MSVLLRNRKMAKTEYVMQMVKLHEYTQERMQTVPARLKKYVCPHIMKLVTLAHSDVITGYNLWENNRTIDQEEWQRPLDDAIRALGKLQKGLLLYWVLKRTSDSGMDDWAKRINHEIVLLNGASGHSEGERVLPMIHTYDLKYSESRIFVWKMQELVRYFYPKLSHVPLEYKDALTSECLHLIREALYHVMEGNRIIPKTKKQYEQRAKHFRQADAALNGLQVPLLSVWVIMKYSEREYNQQAELLNEEIKLLRGVMKSDKQRYADLK